MHTVDYIYRQTELLTEFTHAYPLIKKLKKHNILLLFVIHGICEPIMPLET